MLKLLDDLRMRTANSALIHIGTDISFLWIRYEDNRDSSYFKHSFKRSDQVTITGSSFQERVRWEG